MPVEIQVTDIGLDRVRRVLREIGQPGTDNIISRTLRTGAFDIQQYAKFKSMIQGGKQPPHPRRLTSRTGTGRRSIGLDFSNLPRFAFVGSPLVYMAIHEKGGPVKRISSLGKAYTANYPQRAFLQPAVDARAPRLPRILLREVERELARIAR